MSVLLTAVAVAMACGGGEASEPEILVVVSDGPAGGPLRIIDARTGEEREIGAAAFYAAPQWSPEGALIAAWRFPADGSVDEDQRAVIIDAVTGEETVVDLPGGARALPSFGRAWSPNGERLAVTAPDAAYLVDRHGRVVAEEEGAFARVVWSRDAAWAAFQGERAVAMVAADGSGAHRFDGGQSVHVLGWSDDGTLVVFAQRDRETRFLTLRRDGAVVEEDVPGDAVPEDRDPPDEAIKALAEEFFGGDVPGDDADWLGRSADGAAELYGPRFRDEGEPYVLAIGLAGDLITVELDATLPVRRTTASTILDVVVIP